jgi:uncharacterized protein YndB with AHSA1/START domain
MIDERTLRTSRNLPYSPQQVYAAFRSAELLALWWGPDGFSNTFEVFEFSEGGRWSFVMHGPDGQSYRNESVFEMLVPDAGVVIRHACPPHFTLTVKLSPAGGGTHVSWEQVFDEANVAQAVKQRVGPANEQNLDRLTRVLSEVVRAT